MSLKNLLRLFIVGNFTLGLVACGGTSQPNVNVQATVESAVQATLTAQPTSDSALVLGPGAGKLFDDFNYSGSTDPGLIGNHWTARADAGGPGIPGAAWKASNVSFVA